MAGHVEFVLGHEVMRPICKREDIIKMYLKICGSGKRPLGGRGGLEFSERNLLCAFPPHLSFHVSLLQST